MKRYFDFSPSKGKLFIVSNPIYDKSVVDKSSFNPHHDSLADFMRSEMVKSSSGTPIYDTVNGEIKNVPSEIEIALRNNQLSRAEVSQLSREADKQLHEAIEKGKKDKAQKTKDAINQARQDFIDSKTGFDPNQIQVNSNTK